MRSLGNSTRRCKNPVDYVYGILGMLHFQIPRLTDTNDVWRLFLSELDYYIKNIPQPSYLKVKVGEDAHKVDLRKAKSMADVYKDLLKVSN
ncbi:hypothetical protein K492DRAFT_170992 [Lichtheimia hyalospora FSU 10163]|nr:hypothetical protein K492DRAFT_170992 [Lichtheimia hyalospora FSU 10163]